MEATEEVSLGGTKEQINIVKGKRTKRVRPQSPIPFSMTAIFSTGEGEKRYHNTSNLLGGVEPVATQFSVGNQFYNIKDNNDNNSSNTPTTSSGGLQDSTNEEEDMANCLILLAQGQSRESPKHAAADGREDLTTGGMNYSKYSSKKFLEAAGIGSGRAGYYVYECKTCNRTFPSFQALGGHRASHKKPKAISTQEKKQQHFLFSSDEEEFQFKTNNNRPISLQFNIRGNLYSTNNNKCKVHECSICGAEFTSGQALGGHMRRHRAPVGTNTTLSLTPMALEPEEDQQPRKRRNVLPLNLDLNLPAPEPQDCPTESKFALAPKQQQQGQTQQQLQQQQQQQLQQQQQQSSLVFSTPSLVDCHY
ncbi:PREDICTED: zinc finger protein ZAT5-like [Lupinus angustifolius]|uniref:zinc finger protein ZAT5-like n=1 Tax=Lupinus angustifolius TaxID=3871 RepID=UPI00092F932A|nr:PREDICTED: zinc finger protein ZAT5-like [Lupinus angustifolius]